MNDTNGCLECEIFGECGGCLYQFECNLIVYEKVKRQIDCITPKKPCMHSRWDMV
jgi:hypothetical protein